MRQVERTEMWKDLAPYPHEVAENWEGYLSCKNPSWRVQSLNPMIGFPSQSTQSWKKSPYIWLKIIKDYVHWERQEFERNPGALLAHKILSAATHLGFQQKKGSLKWSRVLWGETGLYSSGERAEMTAPRVPVPSPTPIPQTWYFLGWALPFIGHQPGEQH